MPQYAAAKHGDRNTGPKNGSTPRRPPNNNSVGAGFRTFLAKWWEHRDRGTAPRQTSRRHSGEHGFRLQTSETIKQPHARTVSRAPDPPIPTKSARCGNLIGSGKPETTSRKMAVWSCSDISGPPNLVALCVACGQLLHTQRTTWGKRITGWTGVSTTCQTVLNGGLWPPKSPITAKRLLNGSLPNPT